MRNQLREVVYNKEKMVWDDNKGIGELKFVKRRGYFHNFYSTENNIFAIIERLSGEVELLNLEHGSMKFLDNEADEDNK